MSIQPAHHNALRDAFLLRFREDGLRAALKVRAAQNERSLNSELLFLIKKGLAADGQQKASAERQTIGGFQAVGPSGTICPQGAQQ